MKLLLSHLFPDKCERRNTCLLIIRPVKVGSKKLLTNQFRLYEPPEQYVSIQSHDIWNVLLFACRQFESVALLKDSSGKVQRTVILNNISCVFEFAVYKYIYQEASSEEAVPIIRSISKLDISTRDIYRKYGKADCVCVCVCAFQLY